MQYSAAPSARFVIWVAVKGKHYYADDIRSRATTGNVRFTGFGLDHDEEILEGQWAIEIWVGDEKLASQTFNVTRSPAPEPEKDGVIVSSCRDTHEIGFEIVGGEVQTT